MQPKRRTAPLQVQNNCQPGARVSWFDGLPRLTFSTVCTVNLNCRALNLPRKKLLTLTHVCSSNIGTINKTQFANDFLYETQHL